MPSTYVDVQVHNRTIAIWKVVYKNLAKTSSKKMPIFSIDI
jgi:hypothetical protein